MQVGESFTQVDFHGAFATEPVVFSQITTDVNGQPMVTRMRGMTTTKFDLRL